MAKKMRALFNNADEYTDFQNKLIASTSKQRTFDAVRGQSATSRREAARDESNSWIDKGVAALRGAAGATTSPVQTGAAVLQKVGQMRPGATEAAREATARRLLEADPIMRSLRMRLDQGLLSEPFPQSKIPLMPAGIGGLLGIGAAGASLK